MSDLADRTRRELEAAGYRLDGVVVEAPFMRPGHDSTRVLYRIDIDGEDQVIEGTLRVDNLCTAGYIARLILAEVRARVAVGVGIETDDWHGYYIAKGYRFEPWEVGGKVVEVMLGPSQNLEDAHEGVELYQLPGDVFWRMATLATRQGRKDAPNA